MLASSIPAKFTIPWANSAGGSYINAIPTASQIGTNAGYASFTDGFVPLNGTPIASGGVPPRIEDWNGILKDITLWNQWQQSAGPITYDSAFQSAVGGYPRGAMVGSSAGGGAYWLSTTDNNTTNPEANGAGWTLMLVGVANFAVDSGTANTITVTVAAGAFTPPQGTVVAVRARYTNAGPTSLTINGYSYPVTQGGATLSGGEILANWDYYFLIDNSYARMIGSGAGAVNVGPASAGSHAVQLSQISGLAPFNELVQYGFANGTITGSATSSSCSWTFTPNRNSLIKVSANASNGGPITSFVLSGSGYTTYGSAQAGNALGSGDQVWVYEYLLTCTAGVSVTLTFTLTVGAVITGCGFGFVAVATPLS